MLKKEDITRLGNFSVMYLKCLYLVYILYTDLSIREFMDAFTAAFPTVR